MQRRIRESGHKNGRERLPSGGIVIENAFVCDSDRDEEPEAHGGRVGRETANGNGGLSNGLVAVLVLAATGVYGRVGLPNGWLAWETGGAPRTPTSPPRQSPQASHAAHQSLSRAGWVILPAIKPCVLHSQGERTLAAC